jgi:serine/threonine protein kinase
MCESVYSHKIDEWSVGCIMLEMVIGGPPFRGKPECTCQCPQVTHRNFNSDQLARIFLITGSPDDKMVKRLPCQVHIRGWPKAPRKLERTVEKMMTNDRFRLGGNSTHSVTQAEMEEAVGNWSSLIGSMLELDPRSRWTCRQASEVLAKMVAAEKRSPSQRESVAKANASPTSSAPDGPKAASPNSESGRLESGSGKLVDTSPLSMTSPDRDLPCRQIPSCYSQFNDSKHSRLANHEQLPARATTATSPLTPRTSEVDQARRRTLQLRASRQTRMKSEALSHARGRAPAGFERTRSRSLSPSDDKRRCVSHTEEAANTSSVTASASGGKNMAVPPAGSAGKDRRKEGTASDVKQHSDYRRFSESEAPTRGLRLVAGQPRSKRGTSPDRLEGNFGDNMQVFESRFESRRVKEVSTAPASVADGMAKAAAASGRFLQIREAGNRTATGSAGSRLATRSPTRTGTSPVRIPALTRPSTGYAKTSSADISEFAFMKTLSRTSEMQALPRTCEMDDRGRTGPHKTKDCPLP